jgi:hypothetical protein
MQEITTISWGKRIINAFWGALFGFVAIFTAFFLIFWNEGNSLHTAQALKQTEKILIPVPNSPIDPKNNMLVIYTSGLATTENILTDKLLHVSEKAIQLNRKVEMYQWKEDVETKSEKQVGGSEQEMKTYHYNKQWSQYLIDSTEFKEQSGHENPSSIPLKSEIQYANKVMVGDYSLPSHLIKQISGDKSVDLSKINTGELKKRFKKSIQLQNEQIYIGDDEQTPKIGDMRVSETAVYPQNVSIIAQQSGNTLQAYVTPAGRAVSLLEMGQLSPQEMIQNAEAQNRTIMWLLRLATLGMMMAGLALIMNPIGVLADFIPFVGSLIKFGTGFIALIAGFCLWIIAIAIAWFAVRPLMSVCIIAISVACGYVLFAYRKRRAIKK